VMFGDQRRQRWRVSVHDDPCACRRVTGDVPEQIIRQVRAPIFSGAPQSKGRSPDQRKNDPSVIFGHKVTLTAIKVVRVIS
jgi:hypothetical protein